MRAQPARCANRSACSVCDAWICGRHERPAPRAVHSELATCRSERMPVDRGPGWSLSSAPFPRRAGARPNSLSGIDRSSLEEKLPDSATRSPNHRKLCDAGKAPQSARRLDAVALHRERHGAGAMYLVVRSGSTPMLGVFCVARCGVDRAAALLLPLASAKPLAWALRGRSAAIVRGRRCSRESGPQHDWGGSLNRRHRATRRSSREGVLGAPPRPGTRRAGVT